MLDTEALQKLSKRDTGNKKCLCNQFKRIWTVEFVDTALRKKFVRAANRARIYPLQVSFLTAYHCPHCQGLEKVLKQLFRQCQRAFNDKPLSIDLCLEIARVR